MSESKMYYEKYLKYKEKYAELKGGGWCDITDYNTAMKVVMKDGMLLQRVSLKMKNYLNIFLAAINQNPNAYKLYNTTINKQLIFSSNFTQANYISITTKAVEIDGLLLEYTSLHSRTDPICTIAVNTWGGALQYVPQQIGTYDAICTAAVTNWGLALQYASVDRKNDAGVVTAAVQQNGLALQYAHDAMKNDDGVVTAAVTQNGLALQYAHDDWKNTEVVVTAAVTENGLALQYAPALQNNNPVVLLAVQQNGLALKYAPALQNNNAVVTHAVQQNGLALQYASVPMKQNRHIVTIATISDTAAFKYADNTITTDFSLVQKILITVVSEIVKAKALVEILAINTRSEAARADAGDGGAVITNAIATATANAIRAATTAAAAIAAADGGRLVFANVDVISRAAAKEALEVVKTNKGSATKGSATKGSATKGSAMSEGIKAGIRIDEATIPAECVIKIAIASIRAAFAAGGDNDAKILAGVNAGGVEEVALLNSINGDAGRILYAKTLIANTHTGAYLKIANILLNDPTASVDTAIRNDILQHIADNIYPLAGYITLVQELCDIDGMVLEYASPNAKQDSAVVTQAVKENGMAIQYADDSIKRNYSVAVEAVKNNGLALQFIPLTNYTPVIIQAVIQNGMALQYASALMRQDPFIQSIAQHQNPDASKFFMRQRVIV